MTDIALLLKKYLKDELSEEESRELELWKGSNESNRRIFEKLANDEYVLQAVIGRYKIDSNKLKQKIHARINAEEQPIEAEEEKKAKIRPIWTRLNVAAAVAAVLVLLAVSSIYIINRNEKPGVDIADTENVKPDIAPGAARATLQLADGRTIVLDSTTMGQLAQEGGMQVINKDGELVYSSSPAAGDGKSEIVYNTVSTGKGQTYPVILSDHSRAWLNAESSIRFPVGFAGDIREVQTTGEVFFEVARVSSSKGGGREGAGGALKPFIVKVNDMEVKVLGTKFNVNAYPDEDDVKTTLVEGSVQIKKGIRNKIIKPGQQAQVLANEIKVTEADVDKVIAWKNGLFTFKEDKLGEVMKNITRWYNIDVVYEGNAANVEVSGDIPRNANLSELLKILSVIDVEGRIEGRKLILKAQ